MRILYIITGANKGLGKAFYNKLIKDDNNIIVSLSRRVSEDQSFELINSKDRFHFINLDLSNLVETTPLNNLNEFKNDIDKVVFINNAGSIMPIGVVGELKEELVLQSIHVNVISPTLISIFLLKNFSNKYIDFVNITSGAAKRSIEGWSIYCSSKSYASSFFKTLELETKNNHLVKVFEFDPGVLDTEMQEMIRVADKFPSQDEFIELKEKGKLQDPHDVAKRILMKIDAV